MFGRKSLPCRVFDYGLLPPVEREDIVLAEMRRRNDYWNRLVELERECRARAREILTLPDDPVAALRQEREILREEIKARKKSVRSGKVDVDDLKERLAEIKGILPQITAESKEKRKVIATANKSILEELESERRERAKAIRKTSGLYWCNYDSIEKNYNTARQKAMREGKDLKFHRWTGEGKLSLRLAIKNASERDGVWTLTLSRRNTLHRLVTPAGIRRNGKRQGGYVSTHIKILPKQGGSLI